MPAIMLVDPLATAALGRAIATRLGVGDLVLLDGPFGAGKTTLVRALVTALGGDPALVASPTFSLMNRYEARIPVLHVDAYRFERPGQLTGLGFLELCEEGVGIIEWSERVADLLAGQDAWRIRLDHGEEGSRTALVASPRRVMDWAFP